MITEPEEAVKLILCAERHRVLDPGERDGYFRAASIISRTGEEAGDTLRAKALAKELLSARPKYDEARFEQDWASIQSKPASLRTGAPALINELKKRGIKWVSEVFNAGELDEKRFDEMYDPTWKVGDAEAHPYFKQKGLAFPDFCPCGVDKDGTAHFMGVTLDGDHAFIQAISPSGDKRLRTKMKEGGFIGPIPEKEEWIIVCEGIADNAAIRQAFLEAGDTRIQEGKVGVLSAMSVQRLLGVVTALRAKLPAARITVAVDDDKAGRDAAAKVATAAQGVDFALPPAGKDFDDARREAGARQALDALEAASFDPLAQLPRGEEEGSSREPESARKAPSKRPGRRANATQQEHTAGVLELMAQGQMDIWQDDYPGAVFIKLAEEEAVPLDGVRLTRATRLLEEFGLKAVKRDRVRFAIEDIAESRRLNSLTRRIQELPRPGRYIDPGELFLYVGAEDNEYTRALGRTVLFGAIDRGLNPGAMFEFIPILLGPQGEGKTRFIRALPLLPSDHGELNFHAQEDNRTRLSRGKHIMECAEMNGFSAREVEELKAYVSRREDELVKKYQEEATKYPRQFIVIGTTNERHILPEARNRRFPVLEVGAFAQDAFLRDKADIWASAKDFYEQEKNKPWSERSERLVEELFKEREEEYRMGDPWKDVIQAWAANNSNDAWTFLPIEYIAKKALDIEVKQLDNRAQKRIVRALAELGAEKKKVRWPKASGREGTYPGWRLGLAGR
jgi:putative DNA primase/helicase